MIFRNSSFRIWLIVLAFAGFSATTVMVQPSQTAEVRSPAVSSNFHDFDKSIKNLQNFLDSVDSSDARAIKLAAAGDNSEKQPSDSGCDDALSEKSDSELFEKKDCPPGNDPDSLLTDTDTGSDSLLSDSDTGSDSLLTDKDDDKLLDSDDDDSLLTADGEATETEEKKKKDERRTADAAHEELFLESRFPPAITCATCHPKHYKEWSVSQHSYAQLSPVYLSLSNKILQLSSGSNGDFCLRCHSPVGANLGESPIVSNLDRNPTSREGITCVVCHRVNKAYNKISGRLALVEGGLTAPIYGPTGNAEMSRVLANPEKYQVQTDPDKPGRKVHEEVKLFKNISGSTFCGQCHDVTLFNGFRLEEAFSEYRMSPAAAKGITCQDCHMGKVQGRPSGYDWGPAAVVGDEPTIDRKLTSHVFSGPDYPVIHPGIFPHNVEAKEFKTLREWLKFNHKAGWGTDKFEDNISDDHPFPKEWKSRDDRYDAREILDEQFEKLEWAAKKRLEVLRNGYFLGDIITDRADERGIKFRVQVKNLTDGHNAPTGFTGERMIWLDVTVTDRTGAVVFRSGERDPNGDLKDNHSEYVHAGKMKLDRYLFNLQSLFVTQSGRGAEIEHVIPVPYPVTALPRVLPSAVSLIFTGEPATERVHKKGIEPLGERWAKYKIRGRDLTGRGPYKAWIKLRSQLAPANLILAIQDVGFDYFMTPAQVGGAVIAGSQTLWRKTVVFDVDSNTSEPRTKRGGWFKRILRR